MAATGHPKMTTGTKLKLKGADLTKGFAALADCESACVKTKGCIVVNCECQSLPAD